MRTADLQRADPERVSRVEQLAAKYAGWFEVSETRQHSKPVIVNGVRYESAHKAAKATGYCESGIREACRGYKQIRGVVASYAE